MVLPARAAWIGVGVTYRKSWRGRRQRVRIRQGDRKKSWEELFKKEKKTLGNIENPIIYIRFAIYEQTMNNNVLTVLMSHTGILFDMI